MKTPPWRVVIVDDHDMFRAGVRAMLDPDRFEVVGEADDVASAVAVVSELTPDLVLLDIHLPDGLGSDVITALEPELTERVNFLAFSVSDAPEDVGAVIRAGARGYITKTITPADLGAAAAQAAQGFAVFSPKLAGFVLSAMQQSTPEPAAEAAAELSRREREVLQLIARGYTYRETADELFVSIKTIETHVSAILRKLKLSNRHEITSWASRQGIVG